MGTFSNIKRHIQGGISDQQFSSSASDYLVISMVYNGTPEKWLDYTRQVCALYARIPIVSRTGARAIGSVYLVKLEFEVENGVLVRRAVVPEVVPAGGGMAPPPPAYGS